MKYKTIIRHIVITLLMAAAMLVVLLGVASIAGCSQRECTYVAIDPNSMVIVGFLHYKSNHAATDTKADSFRIKTPGGVEIEFNKFKQDNDSFKGIVPAVGAVQTND